MSDYSGVLGEGVLGNLILGDDPSEGNFAFGQAQLNVIQTYNKHAQAQLYIGVIFRVYAQAQLDCKQDKAFGQAQCQVTLYRFHRVAQAQAMVVACSGLLAVVFYTDFFNHSIEILSHTYNETGPNQINYSGNGYAEVPFPGYYSPLGTTVNFGINWIGYFEADVTGSWTFRVTEDDGATIYFYDESNNLVGSVINTYGTGQGGPTYTDSINLTAGTRYKIVVKWAQYGGGWKLDLQYHKPNETTFVYLTDRNAPWIHCGPRVGFGQAKLSVLTTYNVTGQAQALLNTAWGFGQAQLDVNQTYNKHGQAQLKVFRYEGYGQAQLVTIPCGALLAIVYAGSSGNSGPETGSLVGFFAEEQPNRPNYNDFGPLPTHFPGNNNWGMRWIGWFVADVTGSWKFATSSDDGSRIYIYDESGSFVGGVNNNYTGGQGNTYQSANVSLTAGTRYFLDMRFGQGGGAWNIQGYYRRPADTSDSFLTDGSPPWMVCIQSNSGQAQLEVIYGYLIRAIGQAQLTVTGFQFGQAQAYLRSFDYPQHGQAQLDVKTTYRVYAQAQLDVVFTYQKPAQAQFLVATFYFAQAQAKINAYDYPQFGQANLDVLAIVNKHGQAQLDVVTINYRFAQAQMRVVYNAFGQAQARIIAFGVRRYGQAQIDVFRPTFVYQVSAQANLLVRPKEKALASVQMDIMHTYRGSGQARLRIGHFASGQATLYVIMTRFYVSYAQMFIGTLAFGQAQAQINAYDINKHAQAQAKLNAYGVSKFGQALTTLATRFWPPAQAQMHVHKEKWTWGQARLVVERTFQIAQAELVVTPNISVQLCAQAQLLVVNYYIRTGCARLYIHRTIKFAQANMYITRPDAPPGSGTITAGGLVKFGSDVLPGYYQSETLESPLRILIDGIPYLENVNQVLGLENKYINIKMLVHEDTYFAAKEKVLLAATMLRRNRDSYQKLTLMNPLKYYLARTKSISMEQRAGLHEREAIYEVSFECRPWLYGDEIRRLTGTTTLDTNSVGRTIDNGTWTPTRITLTGTNVTVSGYTPTGQFTGFVSVSGSVSNLIIDSEYFTTDLNGEDADYLMNIDYRIYTAPGRTLFDVQGASDCTIEYQDRWSL